MPFHMSGRSFALTGEQWVCTTVEKALYFVCNSARISNTVIRRILSRYLNLFYETRMLI